MENPGYDDGNEDIPHPEGGDDDDPTDQNPPRVPTGEGGGTSSRTSTVPEEIPGSKVTRLSEELKRQKIYALHQELGVSGNINLAELDRFRLSRNEKTGKIELEFRKGLDWVSLTNKYTGEFLAKSSLEQRMGGVYAMKHMLGLDRDPLQSERSKTAARKLAQIIPTDLEMDNISMQDLSRVIIDVEHEIRDISQNTDLDMREIIEQLQKVHGELTNNEGKLTSINKHIELEEQKFKDIKNDLSYSDEQRREVEKRLERLKEEHSDQQQKVSKNKKELQSQFDSIRLADEKVLDGDTTLGEKIKTIFREKGITIIAVITAVGTIISTIVLAIKNALGISSGSGGGSKPPKDSNKVVTWLRNQLKALARLLGKLAGKLAAALPGLIGSIISGILNFLKTAVGFLAQHVWLVIVFLVGLVSSWIWREVSKKKRA